MPVRAFRWMTFVLPLLLATAASAQPEADEPAGEPADAETPAEDGGAAPAAIDEPAAAPSLDDLRARYRSLRDRLFESRARAATVASALYSTHLRVSLHFSSSRSHTVTRASIRLDGASVYDDLEGAIAKDEATRFSGYVAPGRHVVTIRVEAAAKDDPAFTTAVESSFVVQAPAGKDLVVAAVAEDDGDMGYAWKKDGQGSYRLHLNVDVKATAPEEGSGHLRRTSRVRRGDGAVRAAQVAAKREVETGR